MRTLIHKSGLEFVPEYYFIMRGQWGIYASSKTNKKGETLCLNGVNDNPIYLKLDRDDDDVKFIEKIDENFDYELPENWNWK